MGEMTRFYCTWCGSQHAPDLGTLIDARYAMGNCHGTRRQLVRDPQRAEHLANTVGKFRPKGTPLGRGQPKPRQITIADAEKTRAIQEGRG